MLFRDAIACFPTLMMLHIVGTQVIKSDLFAYRDKVNITMMALQEHFCRTPTHAGCNLACLALLCMCVCVTK